MELIKNKAESAAGKRHNRRKGTKDLRILLLNDYSEMNMKEG